MTLAKYLADNGLTQTEFATKAGLDQGRVSLYVRGRAIPRPAMIKNIESLTSGQVQFTDWFTQSGELASSPSL